MTYELGIIEHNFETKEDKQELLGKLNDLRRTGATYKIVGVVLRKRLFGADTISVFIEQPKKKGKGEATPTQETPRSKTARKNVGRQR